jgi:hypothetical protein
VSLYGSTRNPRKQGKDSGHPGTRASAEHLIWYDQNEQKASKVPNKGSKALRVAYSESDWASIGLEVR